MLLHRLDREIKCKQGKEPETTAYPEVSCSSRWCFGGFHGLSLSILNRDDYLINRSGKIDIDKSDSHLRAPQEPPNTFNFHDSPCRPLQAKARGHSRAC